MNSLKYLIISLLLIGCFNHKVQISDLRILHNKYYYKEEKIPFSGIVISKFESGQVLNEINVQNGIPIGNWVAYGYDGEVVQNGTFRPFYLRKNRINSITGIERINLCPTKEGNVSFIDLYIITNNANLKFDKKSKIIYAALIDTLKSNNIKIDTNLIDKIYCDKGEL